MFILVYLHRIVSINHQNYFSENLREDFQRGLRGVSENDIVLQFNYLHYR